MPKKAGKMIIIDRFNQMLVQSNVNKTENEKQRCVK